MHVVPFLVVAVIVVVTPGVDMALVTRNALLHGRAAALAFAAGVNAGIAEGRRLGCGSFVLLNPDVRPSVDVLLALRELVTREPDVVASPRLRQPGGTVEFAGSALDLDTGRIRGARAARRPGGRWTAAPPRWRARSGPRRTDVRRSGGCRFRHNGRGAASRSRSAGRRRS